MFILQDENHPGSRKGVVETPTGAKTVAGGTADAIKVSYIDGKMVSVDSYDFTEGVTYSKKGEFRNPEHAKTVANKMDLNGPKPQTQNVVFFAEDDAQAADMRARVAGGNARVVNLASGYDTGELYSETHMAARAAAQARSATPRTPAGNKAGGAGGAKGMRMLGGLNVVADVIMIHDGAKAVTSDDPRDSHRFMCDYFNDQQACANGYGLPEDEWIAKYGS